MKILISHPTSNEFNRAAAFGLYEANLLAEFHTAIASFPGSLLNHVSKIGAFKELKRREFNSILKPYIRTWPWLELGRQISLKAGFFNLATHEKNFFSIDAVYQSFDKRVASRLKHVHGRGVSAVYAYEDGAYFSFPEAKHLGLQCFYDLPIGYWRAARKLMEPERERWPDWIPTLTGFADSEAKLARKDEELRLADKIFVASQFTANTLKDYPGALAPIEVIPYGFPSVKGARDYDKAPLKRPLKLLFVGGLSQRKGIADLFAAVEAIKNHVELTVVGRKFSDNCPALDAALAKHRWIPSLPHSEILNLMRQHDVLVFPSLFEGFGLVISEAMSQGTPVITTERTAGPDLIVHDENGWLIEAGSTQALISAIEKLLLHPETIAKAGKAALDTARRRPWEVYGRELAEAINKY